MRKYAGLVVLREVGGAKGVVVVLGAGDARGAGGDAECWGVLEVLRVLEVLGYCWGWCK